MVGLQTAATLLGGQAALADALVIGPRAVRAKLGAERGITRADLTMTSAALRAHAARITAHAAKLDALAEGLTA